MELWQTDVVSGVLPADGREVKVVTGVDDHSRCCVIAKAVVRATGRTVPPGPARPRCSMPWCWRARAAVELPSHLRRRARGSQASAVTLPAALSVERERVRYGPAAVAGGGAMTCWEPIYPSTG
ncbi:hypothetical protein [Nonomuraea sp. NPDC001699]